MTADRREVLYGNLGLLVLKTLAAMGPLHGYRIARRIEQISSGQLAMNQGTLYPALLRLEQEGWIASKCGESDSGRRVKVYALTRAGRRELRVQEADGRVRLGAARPRAMVHAVEREQVKEQQVRLVLADDVDGGVGPDLIAPRRRGSLVELRDLVACDDPPGLQFALDREVIAYEAGVTKPL